VSGFDFDAVVVGSGFGGSVVTCRLAEAGLHVCLLERGRAYPPGSFARTPVEMAQAFWAPDDVNPQRGTYGLFDVWSFTEGKVLVSSGLGGGSLIYANVMLRPLRAWPDDDWPIKRRDLDPYYDTVEAMLGAQRYPWTATTPKSRAFTDAARATGMTVEEARVAVTFARPGEPEPRRAVQFDDGDGNLHKLPRTTCRLCGECDIGCNYGSKNTLDFTYLSRAVKTDTPAEIRPSCEVTSFEPLENEGGTGFRISYIERSFAESSDGGPGFAATGSRRITVTARSLILAAGALGSTRLLLRNRSAFPRIGDALGRNYSGNGDLLGFALGSTKQTEISFGPVITTSAYSEGAESGQYYVVQDGGVPAFTLWPLDLFGRRGTKLRSVLSNRFLRHGKLQRLLWHRSPPGTQVGSLLSAVFGDGGLSAGSLPLLAFGREAADGEMSLRNGELEITWPTPQTHEPYYAAVQARLALITEQMGGHYASPAQWLLGEHLVSVHPLGGCPMHAEPEHGVVDLNGQVHHYERLYVADGSIVPRALGVNPSLTIAATAELISKNIVARLRQ
jgi:cholesterol oxidase